MKRHFGVCENNSVILKFLIVVYVSLEFVSSHLTSVGINQMAHLRRIHYQGKRCCSTPAVASLPDFSDKYFEEIKVSPFMIKVLSMFFKTHESDNRILI